MNDDIIGSMEFASKVAGSRSIVVTATCDADDDRSTRMALVALGG